MARPQYNQKRTFLGRILSGYRGDYRGVTI